MQTRGKFQCNSVTTFAQGTGREYQFYAVCNDGTPENDRFHKYTPSGSIKIIVDNPNITFEPGKVYYVDFTEAQ
jgi:hypothetical protein